MRKALSIVVAVFSALFLLSALAQGMPQELVGLAVLTGIAALLLWTASAPPTLRQLLRIIVQGPRRRERRD
jgi:hypothetical protein